MKNKLDKMEYSEFIEYLDNEGLKYTETKNIDECLGFEEVLYIEPESKQLKMRMFSTDGGWQMFEGVNYFD